jgi:hypothetical protein
MTMFERDRAETATDFDVVQAKLLRLPRSQAQLDSFVRAGF